MRRDIGDRLYVTEISIRLLPHFPGDISRLVFGAVTVTLRTSALICDVRHFIGTKRSSSWDWKKEEKESGITEETLF